MRRYTFTAESDDAANEMKEILDNAPFERDAVRFIEVRVTIDDEVETGPVADFEREDRGYTRNGTAGGSYQGSRFSGAVMPDTQRARILTELDGRWMTSSDIADELGMDSVNVASAELSDLFLSEGYVKRRDVGNRFEYTLDDDGREALKAGEKRYKAL